MLKSIGLTEVDHDMDSGVYSSARKNRHLDFGQRTQTYINISISVAQKLDKESNVKA